MPITRPWPWKTPVSGDRANSGEERLAGFNRIIRAISSSLALEGVFQLVSWEVNSLLPHNRASVAMADPGGETATVYATAGEEGALGAGNVIPLDGSLVGEVIRSGRGCFKTDFEQEKDFVERRELLTTGIRSNVTVPLWYGEECIGALNFGSFEAGAYGPDHLTLAQEIADQVTVAIINARLYGEAQQLAVSEERNRMAREIHDTLAQGLTGIVLQLEGAEQVAGESIEELEDHLARAKEHARECLREARRSVWNLLPPALEKMSLPAALQDEVRRFSDGGSEQASFKAAGRSRDLSARVQAALLRICQESLTNVRKHAQASQVSVGLTFQADRVLLHVQDNGKGFDPEAPLTPTAQGGFGLRGIRERADELAGQIVVVSDRSGTLVQATIPTGEAAAA